MPTPSELVTERFAQAQNYAAAAEEKLELFTEQLNAAIQQVPLVSAEFASLPDPGASHIDPYVPPADYTSTLMTTLAGVLTTRLAGGTGIATAVETAIWDRARERELALAQGRIDQVTRDSEALGYQLPPGVLTEQIRREQRIYFDKSAEFSREVAIKQADLEIQNARDAIERTNQYETTLTDIVARRSQVSIEAFKADVARFQAEVDQDVKHWEAMIKQYEALQNYIINAQKINTEVARANLAAVLEAAKVGAQVYAQLTASAYSMINASASVSAGASNSVSWSYSNDTTSAPSPVTAV